MLLHRIALLATALTITGTANAAPSIHGTLIDSNQDGHYDASVHYTPRGANLVGFNGHTRWTWQATGALQRPPWLIAQGDLNGDHVTDLVFNHVTATGGMCGRDPNTVSALVLVDGRTGKPRPVLDALPSNCHAAYTTTQWNVGTARIGPWGLVGLPMYGGRGWVLGRDGQRTELVTPYSESYDAVYDRANRVPCERQAGWCMVPGSHFPQTVWVPGGLLALSSTRAWVYRDSDRQPSSDLRWLSGDGANSGRNYGYLRAFTHKGRSYATLVGGCTVWNARQAMVTGVVPSDAATPGPRSSCAIHRHIEAFRIAGGRIVSHFNRYLSYSPRDGTMLNRVEVPAQSGSRVVYNLFDGDRWNVHVIPDPARPAEETVLAGRYVWGTSGRFLLASPSRGYVPEWRTELVDGVRVVRSVAGVPVLVNYPDTPSAMFYDSLPVISGQLTTRSDSAFGAFTWRGRVLMRTEAGKRFWLG